MTDDGILVTPSKTEDTSGVSLMFEWTPALRKVVKNALSQRPQVRRYIICGHNGKRYNDSTFSNAWARLQRKYAAAGNERFQFKDLRTKSASDEPDARTASTRLGHSSQATTDKFYRMRPKIIRPLR
jgi:integrase